MAEYVASSSCIKLHMQRGCVREEGFKPRNVHFRMVQRSALNFLFYCFLVLPVELNFLQLDFDLWEILLAISSSYFSSLLKKS